MRLDKRVWRSVSGLAHVSSARVSVCIVRYCTLVSVLTYAHTRALDDDQENNISNVISMAVLFVVPGWSTHERYDQ